MTRSNIGTGGQLPFGSEFFSFNAYLPSVKDLPTGLASDKIAVLGLEPEEMNGADLLHEVCCGCRGRCAVTLASYLREVSPYYLGFLSGLRATALKGETAGFNSHHK